MAKGIGTVQIRRQRGKLVVQGLGQTPRGQRFIRSTEDLKAPTMASKDFKDEVSVAITKMLGEAG